MKNNTYNFDDAYSEYNNQKSILNNIEKKASDELGSFIFEQIGNKLSENTNIKIEINFYSTRILVKNGDGFGSDFNINNIDHRMCCSSATFNIDNLDAIDYYIIVGFIAEQLKNNGIFFEKFDYFIKTYTEQEKKLLKINSKIENEIRKQEKILNKEKELQIQNKLSSLVGVDIYNNFPTKLINIDMWKIGHIKKFSISKITEKTLTIDFFKKNPTVYSHENEYSILFTKRINKDDFIKDIIIKQPKNIEFSKYVENLADILSVN